MTTEQIFTTITVGLTSVNVLLTYFNFRRSRKKEFQDKLFQFKVDAYKTLNDACYGAVKRLDINSSPYVAIYDYSDEAEWVKYCEANMGTEIIHGFKLQDLVYGQAMLSLIHISEPTRRTPISYAVFCLKKKKKKQ